MKSELATLPQAQPTTADLISAVIQTGITPDSVSVVERLVALKEREQANAAKQEFASAFVKMQEELPPIQACKAVTNKDGSPRYIYAPYEEIMEKARPALIANGFGIKFDTAVKDDKRIEVTCKLIHRGGHSEENKFAARIGNGPPSSSEAQGDGAAATYAKRFALCGALNITVEQDNDGAGSSCECISKEQADAFRSRAIDCGADLAKFVKFLKVEKFEDILLKDFGKADAALRMKEAQVKE